MIMTSRQQPPLSHPSALLCTALLSSLLLSSQTTQKAPSIGHHSAHTARNLNAIMRRRKPQPNQTTTRQPHQATDLSHSSSPHSLPFSLSVG
ncbi:hypothetical protein M758_12G186400 [Ceratodon purpureus]|nr:hypothetical protein M758_12G186400 [Ceratodon purpureus]